MEPGLNVGVIDLTSYKRRRNTLLFLPRIVNIVADAAISDFRSAIAINPRAAGSIDALKRLGAFPP
jgi:hypothetical protein